MAHSKHVYSPEFEAAWELYPRRPNDNKKAAYKAWKARRAEGISPEALIEGARAYRAYVESERTEPRFVKMAATFFGPCHHFVNDFTPSATPISENEAQLLSFYAQEQLV